MLRREGYGPANGPAGLVVGERGARTRARIVAEALRLFDERGFHATSVESIATAAGTSRATLYQYFESKEQIFVELLDQCGTALMRVVRRIGPLGPTRLGFDNLHWWLGEWAYVHDRYATMFVQWATVDTPGTGVRPLVTDFSRAYNARVAGRLLSCDVPGMDPLDAAVALTSIVHRFNHYRQMGLVPNRTADQLLDGLAVCLQLLLFPNTPAEVFDVVAAPVVSHRVPTRSRRVEIPDRTANLRPRALATVRALIDAGAGLFADRGYHGTGVDDVVSEAGFARGTFYKYFDEKLDLLLQLTGECATAMEGLALSFAAIEPAGPDGGEQLRSWLAEYLPTRRRYHGVMRAWLERTARDPRLLATAARTISDMHAAALTVFATVPWPYPIDPEIAAAVFGTLLEHLPEAIVEQYPDCPEDRVLALTAAVIERALFNTGTDF